MSEIRCGSCSNTWTAVGACHCSACHETFAGVRLFDTHRSAGGERGRCADPGSITTEDGQRVMFFRDGMWRGPEMTDEQKLARFGVREPT